MNHDIAKKKKIDNLKDNNLNKLIDEGKISPSKSGQGNSKLINFRIDQYTANRLDSLSQGMNKSKTTILKAALLSFENLNSDDRLRLIGIIAH